MISTFSGANLISFGFNTGWTSSSTFMIDPFGFRVQSMFREHEAIMKEWRLVALSKILQALLR
jgi:hypothetical protein